MLYSSNLVIIKFANIMIKRGNKPKAMAFFIKLLSLLKKNKRQKPLNLLLKSIYKVKPTLQVKGVRQGSKIIYLPKLLSEEHQFKQAINWLIKFSSKKKKNLLYYSLFEEVALSLENKGEALDEKNKIYDLLTDNRPFLFLIRYY